MDSEFLREVTEAFAPLIDRGLLAVVSSAYDAQAFGNAFVVLSGRVMSVRMVKDRSEVFANACSARTPDEWEPLQRMLRAVGARNTPPEGLISATEAAILVQDSFDALESGLSPKRLRATRRRLRELAVDAAKRMEREFSRGDDD